MIKIKLTEFREFLRRAKAIRDNGLIPITSYFKLECDGDVAKITKNSLNYFIVHEINAKFKKNITILLDQKIVSGFIASATGEEVTIDIKEKEKEIIMSDEKYKVRQPIIDAKNFPVIKDSSTAKWFPLSKDMIASTDIARGYCATNAVNKTWMDYLWIKPLEGGEKACVFATDGIIMYFKSFESDMPVVVIEPDLCATLSGFADLLYAKVDNYHFFNAGNSLYGFIESEVGYTTAPFEMLVAKYDNQVSFIMEKKEIVEFCDLASSISRTILANCYLEDAGKGKMLLRYVDDNYNVGAERFVAVEKKKTELTEFWFNPKQFSAFFKNLPYEKLVFYQMDKQTFFVASEEDKNYVGIIRGIVAGVPDTATKTDKAKE